MIIFKVRVFLLVSIRVGRFISSVDNETLYLRCFTAHFVILHDLIARNGMGWNGTHLPASF